MRAKLLPPCAACPPTNQDLDPVALAEFHLLHSRRDLEVELGRLYRDVSARADDDRGHAAVRLRKIHYQLAVYREAHYLRDLALVSTALGNPAAREYLSEQVATYLVAAATSPPSDDETTRALARGRALLSAWGWFS